MEEFSKKTILIAMAGLVMTVLFWAINTVVAKGVVDQVPPMALSFYRWLAAFVFLLPLAYKPLGREKKIIKKNLGWLFLLSVPSVAVYNSVLYLGALYTTATNIGLVLAAMPAMTLGLAWAINKEKPRVPQIVGICIALVGVVAIISKGSFQTILALEMNPGDLLILVSMSSWALYSVLLRKKALPLSPFSFLITTVGLGTLIIFPFYLLEFVLTKGFTPDYKLIMMFVYLGICPSILSYICWNNGVKVLGSSIASVFIYLLPVFTAVLAYIFLDERLSLFHLWGGVLIFMGLILSSRSSSR